MPKSLLEAAACGRPMVATDVPGCREICRHEETGLLVPARTVEPLADALATLARDAAARQRYGEAARELAERAFSVDRVVGETLTLYDTMLNGRT